MKKLLIAGAVTTLLIAGIAGAGLAYAQVNELQVADLLSGTYGAPTLDANLLFEEDGEKEDGPLHDYIRAATAEALGITVEELDQMRADGMSFVEIIEAQGLTVDEFRPLLEAAVAGALAQAVEDGAITQEQYNHFLFMGLPFVRARCDPGMGRFGPGQPRMNGNRFGYGLQDGRVAEFLSLSQEQLQERLEAGETLNEILDGEGKTQDELAAFLASKHIEAVNEALENGEITQEQADVIIDHLNSHLENGWDGTFGPFGPLGIPGRGGPGCGSPGQYGPGEGGPMWGSPGAFGPGGHHGKP